MTSNVLASGGPGIWTKTLLLLVVALAVAWAGCVPFVSLPAQINVGGGGAFGSLSSDEPTRQELGSAKGTPDLRIALMPLGLIEGLHDKRAFDLGVGYLLEGGSNQFLSHGPYLLGSYFPYKRPLEGGGLLRLGVDGTGELVRSIDEETGGGFTVGLRIEFAKFYDGAFDSKRTAGYVYGEGALGFYLRGGYRMFSDRRYGTLTAGVTITLPLSAGVFSLL